MAGQKEIRIKDRSIDREMQSGEEERHRAKGESAKQQEEQRELGRQPVLP